MPEDPQRVEQLRPFVRAAFLEQFDREFYAEFGRYPSGSTLTGRRINVDRLAKVQALARHGATEGERRAAEEAAARMTGEREQHRATMGRLDTEAYG